MHFLRRFYQLLTPAQRRQYLLLQLFFLLVGVIQVVGVGSIAPFIALLSRPDLIESNRYAVWLYELLGANSHREFLAAFAMLLMVLIVVSNSIMALSTLAIMRFSFQFGAEIQRDIFRGYLYRDFAELSRKNSATLISSITMGSGRLIYMVVQPLLNGLSQGMIVVIITLGLIAYDPVVAVASALIIGGGYGITFQFVKRRLSDIGARSMAASARRQKVLAEALGGLKEVKLLGTIPVFEKLLDESNHELMMTEAQSGLYSELPKYALESIALCGMLGLGVYLLAGSMASTNIVATLSLYAMAGYRLLPSAQSLFKCISQIRSNANIMDTLAPEILAGRRAKSMLLDPAHDPFPVGAIRFSNVSYTYPESDSPALSNVSFTAPARSITAFVGASGAGKSTAADLVLGLLSPSVGVISSDGQDISGGLPNWQRGIGYVPQSIFLMDDTIAANICFGSGLAPDMLKVMNAARLANLDGFVGTLPEGFNYRVGERGALLSGGQRQRIGIARALYHDPRVLVFDEATSALDGATELEINQTINRLKRSKTVIVIAHRLTSIKAADHLVVFESGQVTAEGDFETVTTRSDSLKHLLGEVANG